MGALVASYDTGSRESFCTPKTKKRGSISLLHTSIYTHWRLPREGSRFFRKGGGDGDETSTANKVVKKYTLVVLYLFIPRFLETIERGSAWVSMGFTCSLGMFLTPEKAGMAGEYPPPLKQIQSY